MKAAPVIAVVFGFVNVMVIFEEPFSIIVVGLKVLTAVGGAKAVRVADAAVPVDAFAVVTGPVLFTYEPAKVAVTGTTIEQLPDAGIVPPDRASELPPFTIVIVPPQVFVVGAAATFTTLPGYVSVKATPEIILAFGLVIVMVMFEAVFIGMEPGLKPLITVGAVRAAWMGTAPSDHGKTFEPPDHDIVVLPNAPHFQLPELLANPPPPAGLGFHRIV